MPIRGLFIVLDLGLSQTPPAAPASQVPPFMIQRHPEWPKARPEDVKSVDAVIAAVGAILSGPAGSSIDLDRLKSLFVPEARLAVISHPKSGSPPGQKSDVAVFAVQDYVECLNGLKAKMGIYERTLVKHSESFGDATHAYASFQLKGKEEEQSRTPEE